MPIIQAVLFDLGGTLLHYEQPPDNSFEAMNGRALRAFLQVAMGRGTRVADPDLAVRAVARLGAALEAKAKRTHYSNQAETVIREGLEAVGVRVPDKVFDDAMRAYYEVISQVVTPIEGDAQEVLRRLAEQGRLLGLVSNTLWAPEVHDTDLQRFGLLEYLPVRVYSSRAGYVKPDERIFRQALDRFDVAPAEAVFVGDKLDVDVAGPQKIGMRTVLLASPFRTEASDEIIPDARIACLDELPDLLDVWDRVIETQASAGGISPD
jgi:putative hydrolase of the HAD superfamily